MKFGEMVYKGRIVSKESVRLVKDRWHVLNFAFGTTKLRKKNGQNNYEEIVFDGEGMTLAVWEDMAFAVDAIPIGTECVIVLTHDIKDGKHTFSVNAIYPLDSNLISEMRKSKQKEKPKPEPKPEPEPELPVDDDDLPF